MQLISPVTLKQLYSRWSNDHGLSFPNYLNLWTVEEDSQGAYLVGVDLQMSLVYEYTGTDLYLKTESELNVFYNELKTVLHTIPENVTVQFVVQVRLGDEALIEQYKRNIDIDSTSDSRYIVDQKTDHFRQQKTYRKRYFIYLTVYPETTDLSKMNVNIFSILKPNYTKLVSNIHTKNKNKLTELANILTGSLQSLGIQLKLLNKKEIINLLYEYLNPGRAEHLSFNEDKDKADALTLRSQIVYNACENAFPQCFVDGYYYRAVNMHVRPKETSYLQIPNFISQNVGEYDLTVTIHSIKQETVIKQLQYNSTLATVISTINPFKRYYEAEQKSAHCTNLVEYVKTTFQKLYQVSVCTVLRDRNLESLTRRTNKCVTEFRNFGESEAVIDDMNHLYLYLSVLPGHSHFNLRKHIFHTESVVQLLPLHHGWTGNKTPKMLFLTGEHELIGFDLFAPELPAKHGVIIGTTGSGKSFTTNLLLTNFYIESQNNHIIVVDIGGSYRKLCKFFDGDYLEIELSDKYGFNPFPAKAIAVLSSGFIQNKKTEDSISFGYVPDKFELDPDTVTYLKLLVQKLLKLDTLTGEQSVLLERAITGTYLNAKHDPPLLSDLVDELNKIVTDKDSDKSKIAKRFVADLEDWTTGIKGKMLNRQTTIHPESRMMVFDLQKLNEVKDLQSIILFLIQNIIARKLYDKTLRKMVVFDECWALFNDVTAAQLVENLYRTARKFNTMVLSISQTPEDFLTNKSASAVLTNSYTKYILRLQKGFDVLDKFGLTPTEISLVKKLRSVRGEFSEILVKSMNNTQILNLVVPKSDYWICTTDAEDLQKEQRVRAQYPNATELEILKQLVTTE